MKKIIGPAACLIAGFGGVALLALTPPAHAECRVTDTAASQGCESIMPPCDSEDSTGPCFWDARERGNGLGSSFVAIPDMGVVPVK